MKEGRIIPRIKKILSGLKPYLRWFIFGATLFFLAKTLKDHTEEVLALRFSNGGWIILAIALLFTLLAHIWSGWVWNLILRELNQPVSGIWSVQTYLKTNIAKYLPGNVWHFYGRIIAAKSIGISLEAATVSVLIEPLLMASAALSIALITLPNQGMQAAYLIIGQILGLVAIAIGIHPTILNKVIQYLSRLKVKNKQPNIQEAKVTKIKRYPVIPFLGELGFVGLRGIGFLLTMLALTPINTSNIPLLLGAFSLAWLLGLVVPGAPGGMGVFEATMLTILGKTFSPGLMLGTVALYRVVSIIAEAVGAGGASLGELLTRKNGNLN